jgi:nitric oxide synthase oxygenase domain/subunit
METYNRSNEVDDRYIDGYEKMYELNKLSRDLDKKLAKTNSLAEQQALIEMLEKVNAYKEEGVEMSEYELKALQAEVELEQARIAMEEA